MKKRRTRLESLPRFVTFFPRFVSSNIEGEGGLIRSKKEKEGRKGGWIKQARVDRAPRWPRRAACTLNYLSRNYSFMLIRLDTPFADLELLPA